MRNRFAHNLTCDLSQCQDLLEVIFYYCEDIIKDKIKDKDNLEEIENHLPFKFALLYCLFNWFIRSQSYYI